MKKLLSIIFFALVFTALGVVISYYWHGWDSDQRYVQGWADRDAYLPPIEDIQKRIGAEVDGIWGRETNRLYEKALGNQYALWGSNPEIREFDRNMMTKVKR